MGYGMLYVVSYIMLLSVTMSYLITCYAPWTGYLRPSAITYHGMLLMMHILDKLPLDVSGDCVNVDNLL